MRSNSSNWQAYRHHTSVTPLTLLAIAYRYSGDTEEAHSVLLEVLDRDPLNHMALFELAKGNYAESEVVQRKLDRILTDDTQYFTDLACYYIDAGLPEDALEVLKTAWSIKEDAMTAYLCAFLYSSIRKHYRSRRMVREGRKILP